ncbi:MAG: MaoC family dehydratase N-terminal domain-containing protein [Gammaproteobacteria bacterium]|nr:MaoC family dehydratase N-terminal domain-containing protein [Gammaproteobacteria bacterium]
MAESNLITTLDEFQEEYRKGIGTVLPHRPSKQATVDNLRRYADGVGDYNPLFRSREYAASSHYEDLIAAPTFLYAVTLGVVAGETGAINRARVNTQYLPVNYAGAEIDFLRPIWRDDTITATEKVGETIRKTSSRIGPINFNTGLVEFTNQRKEVVATIKTLMARYQNTGETLEYNREAKEPTQRTTVPADPLVFERKRQGSDVLYWEDVVEGDELDPLQKGTYSVTELFLFTHGVLGTGRSTRAALAAEGSTDLGGGGRFDEEHAQKRRNMPGQFDYGPQRVCWLAQAATDWMGDHGTLRKLHASIRHPNVVGDTNTVVGKVNKKYIEGDVHLVELSIENQNQSGLATAFATATVALPTQ